MYEMGTGLVLLGNECNYVGIEWKLNTWKRIGLGCMELNWIELIRIGLTWHKWNWIQLNCIALTWIGLDCMAWIGLNWMKPNRSVLYGLDWIVLELTWNGIEIEFYWVVLTWAEV